MKQLTYLLIVILAGLTFIPLPSYGNVYDDIEDVIYLADVLSSNRRSTSEKIRRVNSIAERRQRRIDREKDKERRAEERAAREWEAYKEKIRQKRLEEKAAEKAAEPKR